MRRVEKLLINVSRSKKIVFFHLISILLFLVLLVSDTNFIQLIVCWSVVLFFDALIQAFKNNSIFFISIIYLMIFNIVYLINLNRKNKILTFIYPKYYHAIIFAILVAIYTIFRNIY